MRYFQTTNATRPYRAGGLAFEFEPIEQIGGSSWLGVLEADEPAASILAGAGIPQVSELTHLEYEEVKKKIQERERQLGSTFTIKPSAEPLCKSCGAVNSQQVRNR